VDMKPNVKPGTTKMFEDAAKNLGYADIKSYLWGDYEAQQRSAHYIRQQVGCSQQTLKKILVIYGLPMPITHENIYKYDYLDQEQVAAWLAEGKPIKTCARLAGCNTCHINRFVSERKKAAERQEVVEKPVVEWPGHDEILQAEVEAKYPGAVAFARAGVAGVRALGEVENVII